MNEFNGRFTIYNHQLIIRDHERVVRQLIVYKDIDGILHFTDFHKYCVNPRSSVTPLNQSGNNRFKYVVPFLNYCFRYCNVRKLDDITADMVKEYLHLYGLNELPEDDIGTHRDKITVNLCVTYILDFCEVFERSNKKTCLLRTADLFKNVQQRDKHGHVYTKTVPDFKICYLSDEKSPIYRDIPDAAFNLFLEHIIKHHKNLLGLVILSAFAGLRPSEACNVRREDSLIGPGILIRRVNGAVESVEIDLRKELILRSDRVAIGGIKKERLQLVPDIFLESFMTAYNIYMDYLKGRPCEDPYRAFSLNKQGKAISYRSYYGKFRSIMHDEMGPIYRASDNPEVATYGQTLLTHHISPHILRHWYTVRLVLSGVSEPGVLMSMRGDKNPESALVYLNNKGELEKKYRKVVNTIFEYNIQASEVKYGNKRTD